MPEDLKVQQRVCDALEFEPGVHAEHIGVAVRDGVVTLSGHVGDYFEKGAAERAARRVKGVKAIAQDLKVELPGHKRVADDEIAARALKILAWDRAVPSDAVTVTVEHGHVTLSGAVDWDYQRREAEKDVAKLGGVTGVSNHIVVLPRAVASDVQACIRNAFERAADFDAAGVSVQIEGDGVAVLGGHVPTFPERERAERAALNAPGVSRVRNRIAVGP